VYKTSKIVEHGCTLISGTACSTSETHTVPCKTDVGIQRYGILKINIKVIKI